VLYSVSASLLTFIFTTLLSFLIYTDVVIEESLKNKKYIQRVLYKENNLTFIWQKKIKNAYNKIKTMLILSSHMRKKNLNQNLINSNFIRSTYFRNEKNKRFELEEFNDNEGELYKKLPESFEIEKSLFNQQLFAKIPNFNYLQNIENSNKDLFKKNNRRKKKNDFIKSDNNNIETTLFNNKNTLLFSGNTFINSINKFDNKILFSKNLSSNRYVNEGSNLIGDNVYLTPKNHNYMNRNLYEAFNKEYFQTRNFIYFQLEKFDMFYESNKFNKRSKRYKIFDFKSRHYIFPTNKNVFSCQQISIIDPPILDYFAIFIKKQIKTILIILIYLFVWINSIVFIQSIYKQYGKNIIQICIMPLISMLAIKLTITFNIMMLLTTIILYKWGEYFITNSKLPLIPMIIFKGLVPPIAFHHYVALNTFLLLIKNNKL